MAKAIYGPVLAECISAEPSCQGKAINWDTWRRGFVGIAGTLEPAEKPRPPVPVLL